MKPWKFCPLCASELQPRQQLPWEIKKKHTLLSCKCGFVHYNNPIPVAVCLIPDIMDRIVCIRRKNPPFAGEWALPGGFIDNYGHPKAECVREVHEETGLEVRLEQILCACNPQPGEMNQIIISYLGRIVGGEMQAGDDALEIKAFSQEEMPELCFRSHRLLVENWFNGVYGKITGKDLVW